MKLKPFYFLACLSVSGLLYSQIAITEVYYDTPFNEKLRFGNDLNGYVDAIKHHRGEFIEIYNYSDSDLNLKDWYIKDLQGIFWLPHKIIKKNEFMVIAYSRLPYHTTTFSDHFTPTFGKENQIIYQDQILLRNKKDKVTLGYTVGGQKFVDTWQVMWDFRNDPSPNFLPNLTSNPSQFYSVKSIQYHPDPMSTIDPNVQPNGYDLYNYEATPNPLQANFVPPTQSYADLVKDNFQNYYAYLNWDSNASNLINNVCPINIEKVFQNSKKGELSNETKCFNFDSSGNVISSYNCSDQLIIPGEPNGLTADELNAIKNSIVISPNPTKASDSYNVTMSWSGPALNKINNVQVFNSSATTVYGFAPGQGVNTTTFNLQNQLPGAFVANFVLTTGQVISKNILKW
ncbi:lamin tail domain-containing protein [Chryseobacterium luquanense]|uniref:Lamin tail domain-containing protein n=1 Tax=Chryseobacterium luquanense TaxID=2983766 RepID=A0ABT3Y232_9FLAO|nr:lamin tail domain-containing protein [Chryseobacterium luquanense]MCX8532159.1 lamin tail domain-containing protein [Chryseobacterium luquanense]